MNMRKLQLLTLSVLLLALISLTVAVAQKKSARRVTASCLLDEPIGQVGEIRQDYKNGSFYVFIGESTWGELQCMGHKGPNDKFCKAGLLAAVKYPCLREK